MLVLSEVVLTWFGWLVSWVTAHIQEIVRAVSPGRTRQRNLVVPVVRPQLAHGPSPEANLDGDATDQSKKGMDENSAAAACGGGTKLRESKSVVAADDEDDKDNSESLTDVEVPGVSLEKTAPEELHGSPDADKRLTAAERPPIFADCACIGVFDVMFKRQVDTVADKQLDDTSNTVATSECQSGSEEEDDLRSCCTVNSFVTCSTDNEEEDDLLSCCTVSSFVTCSTDEDGISGESVGLAYTIKAQPEPTKSLSARMQQNQERSAEQQETALRPRKAKTALDRPYMNRFSTVLSRAKAMKTSSENELIYSTIQAVPNVSFSHSETPLMELTFDSEDTSDACSMSSNMSAVATSRCLKDVSDREGVLTETERELASEMTAAVVAATDEAVASTAGCGVGRQMLLLLTKLVPCLVCLALLLLACGDTGVQPDRISAALSNANSFKTAAPAVTHVLGATSRFEPRDVPALSAFDDVVELSMIVAAC